MKRGNLIISILILAVMIPFANAGFLDFFKKDVKESPVDVSVGVLGATPTIITPLPNVADNDNPINPNEINPILGLANTAKIRFVAQDSNGLTDLPGGATSTETIDLATSVGEVTANTANMEVYATNPGTDYAATNYLATTCVEDPACPNCGALPNAREYVCDITMQYYYEPGSWTVTVAIADPGNNIDTDSSKTFTVNALSGPVPSGGITWSAISLSGTNQVADSSLDLTNQGNIDLTSGTIQSYDLIPSGTGDSLPVSAFTTSVQSGVASCNSPTTADSLIDSTVITINAGGTINLPYGKGSAPTPGVESIYFCIKNQLDTLGLTLTSPTYSTTEIGGTSWDLVIS